MHSDDCVKHDSFCILNACVMRFSCVCMKHALKRVNSPFHGGYRVFQTANQNRFPGSACETRFFRNFGEVFLPINNVYFRLPVTYITQKKPRVSISQSEALIPKCVRYSRVTKARGSPLSVQ